MNAPPFRLDDWHRLLAGNAPWSFLAEVALRSVLTFVLLVLAMRWLGRRVAGQYTLFEVAILVTLAAVIGVPLQASNRGLLPPLIIALVCVALHRLLGHLGVRHRRLETAISTDLTLLVKDGRLMLEAMHRTVMGRKKVFELLRMQGYQHLGQIRRAYLEPSGSFSVLAASDPAPGLCVLPDYDRALRDEARVSGYYACRCCGETRHATASPGDDCPRCGANQWDPATAAIEC